MKKRWSSIDVLRIVSFVLILLYHFMVEIEANGYFYFAPHGIFYENANLHMAKIGVVLFFMMSGFGLMAGNKSKTEFSWKQYGKKRFDRILLPYYVVSIVVFLCTLGMGSAPVFDEEIPKWHIIFTILGLDGYLKEYGVSTFHLGVGEWFVGCVLLMYLVFPLLRKAMIKKPDIVMFASTVCYLLLLVFYQGSVPVHYVFPVKLYDFILGMYLAMKITEPSWKISIGTGCGMVILFVIPVQLPLQEDYPNVIFSVLLFLCVFCLEDVKAVRRCFQSKVFRGLAGCSYEMFLIHHWGIIVMNRFLTPQTPGMLIICLLVEIVVIAVGGMGLHKLICVMKK